MFGSCAEFLHGKKKNIITDSSNNSLENVQIH